MYFATPPVSSHKHLDFGLDLKTLDKQGKFAGYASVFDIVDSQHDVIARGAFRHTLLGRVHEIKLLWQHNAAEPIGVFTRIFEDAHGLYVEGKLLLDITKAREAYSLLKAGVLKGLSIGYTAKDFSSDLKSGIRTLTEIDLWEISLVTFPANPAASVTVVKSADVKMGDKAEDFPVPAFQAIAFSDAIDRALHTLRF